jgi:DNA-binding NarL/FixJ family response regulator
MSSVVEGQSQVRRIIIADDHVVLREALTEMLGNKGKYQILAQASDGEQLLELLRSHSPDIVILDVGMPRLDGISTIERMQQAGHPAPVLVLSADEGEKRVRMALKAGAKGYIPKHAGVTELEFAIDSICNGKTYLSPSVTAPLMHDGQAELDGDNPLTKLSKRELEVLVHLADGKPNRVIGKMLHISTRTVDTHRSNILKKLMVKTNAELVKIAIGHNLISV